MQPPASGCCSCHSSHFLYFSGVTNRIGRVLTDEKRNQIFEFFFFFQILFQLPICHSRDHLWLCAPLLRYLFPSLSDNGMFCDPLTNETKNQWRRECPKRRKHFFFLFFLTGWYFIFLLVCETFLEDRCSMPLPLTRNKITPFVLFIFGGKRKKNFFGFWCVDVEWKFCFPPVGTRKKIRAAAPASEI